MAVRIFLTSIDKQVATLADAPACPKRIGQMDGPWRFADQVFQPCEGQFLKYIA
jgi:hypothetical protein